jgi:hypothetical protein
MLKKVVANKLKTFLVEIEEIAAIEFVEWLDEKYQILPGGFDIKQLYEDFLKLHPDKILNDYIRKHKTI